MFEPELCLNLWYYLDAEAGFIYALSGRAYWLSGTDEDKYDILKKLSVSDYKIARRYRLSDRFVLHFGEEAKKGYTTPDIIRTHGIEAFKEVLQELEEEFPPVATTVGGKTIMEQTKIPDNALCLFTALKEEELGEITPVVSCG
ncbi:MAG: hypothetical protein M0T70_05160 [Geobacteraceae bacterium]|nr:hypothetical protein [Geobacteraceae bacterium]